jgi:diguanylate cyclase (GGDEF)-like protein/PAS domain S-box-containing protein
MTKPIKKVLFISENDQEIENLSAYFKSFEYLFAELKVVKSFETNVLLDESLFDLFILDFDMHREGTFEILDLATESGMKESFVIFADEKDSTFYAKSIESGAADFLAKQQIEPILLERVIHNAIVRRKTLVELRESQSKFQDLVERSPAMFYISEIRPPYTQIYASPSFARLGYEIDEWLQEKNIWQETLHPEDREWVLKQTDEAMDSGTETDYEYRIIGKDGTVFWVHDRGHFYRSKNGKRTYWQGLMTDITERKIAQQQLIQKAMFDDLTGLPNRRNFIEKLSQRIDSDMVERSSSFAVLILDLDRFKLINDSLGHVTADKYLIEVGKRLRNIIDPIGTVARLGGDEFVVLIDDADDLNRIKKIAEKIQKEVAKQFTWEGYEFSSTVSIGITISNENQNKPEHFLRNADVAMYHSKSTGRNHFEFFDVRIYEKNMRRLKFETDLRYALERNELSLRYQPIVSLTTGEIQRLEALLRWNHPEFGEIEPDEFIPIAEELGLIDTIGNWVLLHACKQLSSWKKKISGQEELCIGVNISPKQTVKRQSVEALKAVLKKENLEPRHLYLEITESALIENADISIEIIEEIIDLGVKFATDDFGKGYSSLSYLHRFPFEELKIDRSFIGTVDTNIKSQNIVRTIINLAQSLNLDIVAEGIETKEQLAALRELGCELGQGFYFSKAVHAAEIDELLVNGFRELVDEDRFSNFSEKADPYLKTLINV